MGEVTNKQANLMLRPVRTVTHVSGLDLSGPDPDEMARPGGFELPTFWFVARRSIQLS